MGTSSGTQTPSLGTQAPSPSSVRKNAEERGDHSSYSMLSAVTPEEPALQAGAPAFPVGGVPGWRRYGLKNSQKLL
ncbi:MAG: hypothetical protein ABIV48_06730 [Pyrinomonadaceae bacterium]